MIITLKIKYANRIYKQPNCKIKVNEYGRIITLIKKDNKWTGVNGKIIEFGTIS